MSDSIAKIVAEMRETHSPVICLFADRLEAMAELMKPRPPWWKRIDWSKLI